MPAPQTGEAMSGSTVSEIIDIRSSDDIVRARQAVRAAATSLGFSLVDQTKIVTAASELARNALEHGGGGSCRVEVLVDGLRRGLRLTFEDRGPGIADLQLALTDGYSTGTGLGLGLSGSRRLVSDFDIWSKAGEGTRVTVVRWR
jgi:serine/threonine-protein kinase RsbT